MIGLLGFLFLAVQEPAGLTGFAESRVESHQRLEQEYVAHLPKADIEAWMQHMTARPHHVGSPQARSNAEFIAKKFKSWGFETRIEVFHVLFPRPKERMLRLLSPMPYTASLREPPVQADAAAQAIAEEGLPPYNAYSADGDVQGELVYVNQGVPADYEVLERHGIDVAGKIVIARYGGSWRGIKPKVAAEHGAIGCIIFSDPMSDGYYRGKAYPEGAFKTASGVQRGSVVDLPMRPGDPLTPGYGATEDAPRIERSQSETIMKIPVLPISWTDAMPLLRALQGPIVPPDWRGALPITYYMGPGPAKVRLLVKFDWDIVPAYNVIAKLPGAERPDEWVIRGNHHDAWVVGARDPISGQVALMAQAWATSELVKGGWRPKRTLVFCAWDAEEPGLLGSTEWAEHHAEELQEKTVVYINTDGNARGFLSMGGSHSLEKMSAEAALCTVDPQKGVSVGQRLLSQQLIARAETQAKAPLPNALRLSALGSGSDYTSFLQHLGIASLNVAFRGEGSGGEYHTCFDTFEHYSKFLDPGFDYGYALADICGRLSLRFADADIVPFEFDASAQTFGRYIQEIVELTERMRKDTETTNRLVRDGHYDLAGDPALPLGPPRVHDPVPHLNFAPLLNAGAQLDSAAASLQDALQRCLSEPDSATTVRLEELDRQLYKSERTLTRESGLPRRPWFRHQLYAPGFYTGYGVKTLPGVREAIEGRRWDEAEDQIVIAAEVIEGLAKHLRDAARLAGTDPGHSEGG